MYFSFTLPHFEYCCALWSSAADCHLGLLYRAFNSRILKNYQLDLDIGHRRDVVALCILFILIDIDYPLLNFLPSFD